MRDYIKKYTYKIKESLSIAEIEESIIALFRKKYKKVNNKSFASAMKDVPGLYKDAIKAFFEDQLGLFKELLNDKEELKKEVINYNNLEVTFDEEKLDAALDQAIQYVKELMEKETELKNEENSVHIKVFENQEKIIRCKGNVKVDYKTVAGYRNGFNSYHRLPSKGSYKQKVDFLINNISGLNLHFDCFKKQRNSGNSYSFKQIAQNCSEVIERNLTNHIGGNIQYSCSYKLEPLEEYEIPVYLGLITYDNKLFYFECYYDGKYFNLKKHEDISFLNYTKKYINEEMVEYVDEKGKLVDNFLEILEKMKTNFTYYNYLSKNSILKREKEEYRIDNKVKVELEKMLLDHILQDTEIVKNNINNYNDEIRQFLRKRYIDASVYSSFNHKERAYYIKGLGLEIHVNILNYLIDKFYIVFSLNETDLSYEGRSEYHLEKTQYNDIISTLNSLSEILQQELMWCSSDEAQNIINNIIKVETFNHNLEAVEIKKTEEIKSQEIEETKINKNRRSSVINKKMWVGIVSLVLIVMLTIFVFIVDGYKIKHFDMEIVSKNNIQYIENTYWYEFDINIINNSPHDIEEIHGKIYIYNEKNELINTLETSIKADIASKSTYNAKIEFTIGENSGSVLWNTDLAKMRITFVYDFIRYSTFDHVKFNNNKKEIVIHELNEDANEVITGKNLLELAQDYVSKDVIIPENYESENHSEGVGCYSYADNCNYVSFYIFFKISEEDSSTFFNDFVEKLKVNGYQLKYRDIYNDYEYIKGNTVIRFSNVCESYVYNSCTGEEEFEYYYLNFYAYSLE